MKKIIVTTTINPPTKAIERFQLIQDWDLVVIGDKKTPTNYRLNRGTYVTPEQQEHYDPLLSEAIGWNCIQRRNFGLLWALEMGADVIAVGDDDNVPLSSWGENLLVGTQVEVDYYETDLPVFDPIGATNHSSIWHRGFPLQLLPLREYTRKSRRFVNVDVQADFWNGDADIDAICRMEHAPDCEFDDSVFPLAANRLAPFNSQNTFISAACLKHYFLFPHVGRMDDIWAAYYMQAMGYSVVFNRPSVYQERNPHDLVRDMQQEYLGYENNLRLVNDLSRDPQSIVAYLPGRSVRAFELYRRHFNYVYKILITGGSGFVGRRLARRLLQAGHEVHVVDKIAADTGGIDVKDGWPLFEPRDFRNFHFYKEDCRAWFLHIKDTDFDYAFHLAAMVGGRQMIENNPLAVADDLSIDAAYWQWARATKPLKTVCFSSSAAYPIDLQREGYYVLLKEDMISFERDVGMPDMTYGWAKLTCEYLARLAHQKHGLRSVCYRPFSGYGEDQHEAYPFPSICKRAIANRGSGEFTVWGTGTQQRDFIYIEDCVDGILATMDRIDDGTAINLSTGILTSFIEFAQMATNALGYHPTIRGLSDKPSGVHARGGDTEKQRQLGFEHKIDFKSGIAKALIYYGA